MEEDDIPILKFIEEKRWKRDKKWDEDEEDDGNDNDVDARPQLGEALDTFAAHDYDLWDAIFEFVDNSFDSALFGINLN